MPDVIVHHTERNWLVLIEAVTIHGPVNAKRHGELGDTARILSGTLSDFSRLDDEDLGQTDYGYRPPGS